MQPEFTVLTTLGCGQVVRHRFLVSCIVGSNPTTPAKSPSLPKPVCFDDWNRTIPFIPSRAALSVGWISQDDLTLRLKASVPTH